MLKHKKNCKKNLVTIQHRYLEGANNGDRRVVHRLYCPNCKYSKTISFEKAKDFVQSLNDLQQSLPCSD